MIVLVDHGAPARDALLSLIERLHEPDPLAPVTVAVPSPLAGLALRRAAGARAGFANVRFTALARVAELVGAPRLAAASRRPLTPAIRTEAIHTVLADDDGPFAAVAGHPATAEALAATFDELRPLSEADRVTLAARGTRPAAVVRLYAAARALTAHCYDADDVARAAADAVTAGTATAAEVGHLVLFLPQAIEPGEEALLRALAAQDRLTVVLGRSGDAAVDAAVDALAVRLTDALGTPVAAPDASPAGPAPVAHRIISAPDPEDEIRVIARELDERARRGEPLGRVALLSRIPEPYARLVPEVLDAAGIEWTGAAPQRIADAAAGRVLLGLLTLPDADLARDEVAAWLASGPVIDPATHRRVNAARWDELSRRAGVVRGAGQWADRLALQCAELEQELATKRAELEAPEWLLERLARDRDEVDGLAAFVADLAVALAVPTAGTWHSFATWARALLARYVGTERHHADWPDEELEAAQRIDGVLDELSGLDAVGSPVDLSRFSRSLTAELDTRLGRVGRFGAGVLVAPLGQAYAGDFDIVYVLGAVEGSLPPRGREDPLLPDRDRRGITALRPHATRRLEERRDYLTALASAPERVLVFPRADGRAQRTRLPAQWVLETAHALGGTDLTAERLRDTTSASWIDVVDSFEGLVTHRAPASTTEYRLRALGEWRDAGHAVADHPLASGELSRGFVAAHARASSEASAFEGFLGVSPSLAPGVARPTSPTALQDWASCPFRYFLARVLRLRDVPRPEETQTISALDEGTLIHDVLEEFLRDSPALTDPETRWTSADRARLTTLVDAKCDEAEARGITGRRVPWILARRRIVRTAARFLATDEYVRHRYGVVPAPNGLERAFGDDGEPPVEVDLGDGRSVRFRGRIDRVDRAPGGELAVVYDYKTGGSRRYEGIADDPVDAGKALQLPVYALAARAREGTDDAIAAYWFTRFDLDDALLEVSLVEAEERFVDVVGTIVDGAGRGCFPAVPGDRAWNHIVQREVWETCRFCDFDRLCPVDRGTAWGRIRDDEAAAPFRALELPDEVPELDLHAEAGDPA